MRHEDYTVGWICALPVEASAAMGMLDSLHEPLSVDTRVDDNSYTLGKVGEHNVAIACLSSGVTGTTSAALVASKICFSFPSIRFGLMVGVGGGAPSARNDIRLGDVIVSKPERTSGGVIQYDFGKTVHKGQFVRTGSLNQPPTALLNAVTTLQARHRLKRPKLTEYLTKMISEYPQLEKDGMYPGKEHDQLFEAQYDHQGDDDTCASCDQRHIVLRDPPRDGVPEIHYGLIASANQVMRNGNTREKLQNELGVLCFEMEAAGLMNNFPCLVIRGVCDYADTHKNKEWQPYAAATAAAYAKELLCSMPGHQIAGTQTATAVLTDTVKPVFSVTYPKDKHFIERKEIFSKIKEQLQMNHRASLCGIGGVGKSQVAIAYAYEVQKSQPESHIFWIYAASSATFIQAYEDVARQLKLPGWDQPSADLCRIVSDWLNKEDSHWLMILDNADDKSLFFPPIESDVAPENPPPSHRPLYDYLPRVLDSQKSILITTRSKHLGMDLADGESCIEVKPFTTQEAEDLLRSKLGGVVVSFDELAAQQLLETLGCIPLAITQAAAFIKRTTMTVQDYRAALEKDQQNLKDFLSKDLQDPRRPLGFPNSVFRTWELSFKQILKQDPVAAKLLSLIAMLDPQRIPQKLLKCSVEKDTDFWMAIGTLNGFAFITKELEGETYTIHPLVQASVHYWLDQTGEKRDYTRQALHLLTDEFPNDEYENQVTYDLLLAHAQAVLGYDYIFKDDLRRCADLLFHVGCFNLRQGRYGAAHREAWKAYNINQEVRGELVNSTLRSLSLLALVLDHRGMYKEAEDLHRRALNGFEKVLGAEHPNTWTSVNHLAITLRVLGKCKEADILNRRALNGREKVLGVKHPNTLTSVNNLAIVLFDQGKYEEAEILSRRALDGRDKVLGVEHPDTLSSFYSLALLLDNQKRYNDASVLYLRASEGLSRVLGPDHPKTQECSRNYAAMKREMEDQGIETVHLSSTPEP